MKSIVTHTATQPTVETLTDYYPFGMAMPGRSYNAYRYGFNGKEFVFDQTQDYGERIYSPKLARFLSADPLIVYGQEYPELSPYQFASNTPIWAIDLDGLDAFLANTLFDFGPAEQNRAAFYMYNGGIETRKDLGTEVYMDDYINKREE